MYEVIVYLRVEEMIEGEDGRWTVAFRELKLPFAPVSGMSLRFPNKGSDFEIFDSVWDVDHMAFVVYGMSGASPEMYEEVVEDVLENEWVFVEDDSTHVCSHPGGHGSKGGNGNENGSSGLVN